jgi:hypothetical protein
MWSTSLRSLDWKSLERLLFKGDDDMTMLASTTSPTTLVISPTYTATKALTRLITRSQAKKIQQQVHMPLYEFQLNTNDNFMVSKSCMFILFRFTKEEGHNTLRANQKEESHLSQSNMRELSKRNSHIF